VKLAWLHPDCLNAGWFGPDEDAVYVFDDAQIEAAGWGLKRVMFVYETLLALPVEIHRGPTVQTLLALADSREGIVTIGTPDPWLRSRITELQQQIPVEVRPAPVFVEIEGRIDLKRFSRYWSKVEGKLLA
jgi:hypothetical protein